MSIFVAHQGEGNDGQLWHDTFDGENWAGDRRVGNYGMSSGPFTTKRPPGHTA